MVEIPYDIGDWVKVNAVITSHHEEGAPRVSEWSHRSSKKVLHRQELLDDVAATHSWRIVYGRVVGLVRRYEGDVTGFGGEGSISTTGNKLLVQVKPTWTGKIVEALPEDIEPAEPREFRYQGTYEWTDGNRKARGEESKEYPRDAKGRWTGQ